MCVISNTKVFRVGPFSNTNLVAIKFMLLGTATSVR